MKKQYMYPTAEALRLHGDMISTSVAAADHAFRTQIAEGITAPVTTVNAVTSRIFD